MTHERKQSSHKHSNVWRLAIPSLHLLLLLRNSWVVDNQHTIRVLPDCRPAALKPTRKNTYTKVIFTYAGSVLEWGQGRLYIAVPFAAAAVPEFYLSSEELPSLCFLSFWLKLQDPDSLRWMVLTSRTLCGFSKVVCNPCFSTLAESCIHGSFLYRSDYRHALLCIPHMVPRLEFLAWTMSFFSL